jgi:hypothetical protein
MPAKKGTPAKEDNKTPEDIVNTALTRAARVQDRIREITVALQRPRISQQERLRLLEGLRDLDWNALQVDSVLLCLQQMLSDWNPKKHACFYILTTALVNQKKFSLPVNSKEVKDIRKKLRQVDGGVQRCSLSELRQTVRMLCTQHMVISSDLKRVQWNLVVPETPARTVTSVLFPAKDVECDILITRFAPEHAAFAEDCVAFHFLDENAADMMNCVKVFNAAEYEAE